jgi:hypothetical protein
MDQARAAISEGSLAELRARTAAVWGG